jgi:hypothetical protein
MVAPTRWGFFPLKFNYTGDTVMTKMNEGTHIISQGARKREVVEISIVGGKKVSRTYHQKLVGGDWVNTASIKTPKRKRG